MVDTLVKLRAGIFSGAASVGWKVTAEERLRQLMRPNVATEHELRGFLGGCKRKESAVSTRVSRKQST